jgi:predicted small secreted protein
MKRLLALALAATFALPSFAVLSGCNTVEGAGKDIQAGVWSRSKAAPDAVCMWPSANKTPTRHVASDPR